MLKRFLKRIDAQFSLQILLKIIGVLLIVYLLKQTSSVWGNWLGTLKNILMPFIQGFVLAFIIHPLIEWLQRKGIHKNISIIVFWVVVIVLFVVLCLVLMPMLYDKIANFISNLIIGVEWISEKIIEYGEFENFSLIDSFTQTITDFLLTYQEWLPSFVSSLPGFMSSFLDVLTNILLTIIITIYMLFDFDRIKGGIYSICVILYKDAGSYLHRIDSEVSVYMKSLFILMFIKFCEYSLFYFLIGHENWMIIGLLAAIGLVIPYLGGTIANLIGIITALTLSPTRIFFLIAGICVLSNVDAYVISPLVHERRSSLGPLVTLLAVLAGGVLYGAIGIMIAVPVAIAVKSVIEVYVEDPLHRDTHHAK